jgi:Septin
VLITPGVGKTSLIKSLIQTCEDVVHVDAASLQPLQTLSRPRVPRGAPTTKPTSRVTEIHASTKAHPDWWTEADGSNILQRRRSIDENVLGRNVCFIDTPGFDRGTSVLEGMEPALKYLESQIRKSISSQEQTDSELLGMLSGYGGSQVDVVLYLLDHGKISHQITRYCSQNTDLKPADIEYIRQLDQLSNVIPLLAKADTLDDSTIADLKCAAVATLSSSSISLLSLPNSTSNGPAPPFTVCSCPSNDLDAMDASVLMQSECIQSLHQSDLPRLIDLLFEPSNANYFKHSAASKALAFRSSQRSPPHISPLLTSLSTTSAAHQSTHSSLVTTRPLQSSVIPRPSGSEQQARDPRVAQLRLAAWASSLQRSLAHERRRYERLARGDRLAWLRAQLDAYNDIDVPDPITSAASVARKESGALLPLKREATLRNSRIGSRDTADPLGIVRFRDKARHTTWLALQVAGGCGVLGAAVVWALHRWGAFNGGVIAVSDSSGGVREWIWSWWPFSEEEGVLGRLWTWLG